MAELADSMPPLEIDEDELAYWGQLWLSDFNPETNNEKKPHAFDRQQSVNFASFIDEAFARSIARRLC